MVLGVVDAVLDKELKGLLESLNLLDELNSGNLKCDYCGELLTLDNIGCLTPQDKKIHLCCDKVICIQKTIETITPIRKTQRDEDQ